jgi:DNA-binding CsgD family transcriptional regulator
MRRSKLPLRSEPTRRTGRADELALPSKAPQIGEVPRDLRRSDLRLGEEDFVVLSYVSESEPVLLDLSPSESAVVRAAAAGLTNAEIAVNRGCSPFTIQNQLSSAYRKLGVSSRAELTALLSRQKQ